MAEASFEDDAEGPTLSNGLLSLVFNENKGTFDLVDGEGQVVLADGGASVTIKDASGRSTGLGRTFTTRGAGYTIEDRLPVSDAQGDGLSVLLRRESDEHEPELLVTISLYEGEPFAVVHAEIVNKTRAPMVVEEFRPLSDGRVNLGWPAGEWRFYKMGWQSWSPALVVRASGEDVLMTPPVTGLGIQPEARPGRFTSDLMTAIVAPAGGALVAGFISAADQFSHVWLDRDGPSLSAVSYAEGSTLEPGDALRSERFYIEPATKPLEAMRRFGDAMAAEMAAVPKEAVTSGWCTWYYYYLNVREEHVISNLEFLAAHKREVPVEYVQLDDGYQTGIGDWLSHNEKFPHGMKWLVERIHEKGFKAGLWLAPFLMGADSQLFREHPEWAVRNPSSDASADRSFDSAQDRPYIAMLNWNQECYSLDLSRDDVIAWLEDVFRTVCEDWGFDYVKIDFIYAGAVAGIRNQPMTGPQAYRRGLEAIRGVTGNRFVLGCGNPVGQSVGLMDGARIGPDAAPFWYPHMPPALADEARVDLSRPSALNSIRNTIVRFWMHGRLWMNDPDCLLVRQTETVLNEDEVRSLTSVVGLMGGMVLDSDDLTRLSPQRRKMLSMLLPVYGKSAVPLDLFDSEVPGLLDLDCGTYHVLGAFNWADEPRTLDIPLPREEQHVFDVWSREYLGRHAEGLSLKAAAHGCRVLRLTPDIGRPQVVGSGFHLMQGAVELEDESWDGHALGLSLKPVAVQEGEVFVAAPRDAGSPSSLQGSLREAGEGVWALRLAVGPSMIVQIGFG